MWFEALLQEAMDMSPCTTAKDVQHRVVRLALVCHLVWRCVGQDCRQGCHVEQAAVCEERLAPKANG
jgi:hypothetical protein